MNLYARRQACCKAILSVQPRRRLRRTPGIVKFERLCRLSWICAGRALPATEAYLLFYQCISAISLRSQNPGRSPRACRIDYATASDLRPIRALSSTAVRPRSAHFGPPVRTICRMAGSARFGPVTSLANLPKFLKNGPRCALALRCFIAPSWERCAPSWPGEISLWSVGPVLRG
jgi:hypothetical protein